MSFVAKGKITTTTVDTAAHVQPLLHNSHQQLPQTRPRHTSPLEVCMW